MRLPDGLRRRHGAAARLSLRQLGDRLRRPQRRHRPPDRPPPALAAGQRPGALRPPDPGGRAGRSVPPSHPATPAGAGGRPRPRGQVRHRARVLPVPRLLPRSSRQALAAPRPPRRHHRGLPAAPDVARGVHHREDPQPDGGGRDPHRVLQGRGRHRPARDQHHLRRSPGGGRPSPGVQERGQGDRLGVRAGRHLHGQVVHGHGRLLVPHPHQPVGRRDRLPPDGPGGGRGVRVGVLAPSVPSSWPVSSSPPTSWPGASPRT